MPKDLGGLGFGNIKIKNLGLLEKWWWKYSNEFNPLWKRVVQSTNDLKSNFASISTFYHISKGTFNYIQKSFPKYPWVEDILDKDMVIELGDGQSILFWHDSWVGHQH